MFGIEHAGEIVRYGGKEVHAVASIVGAVVGQEAIKILTHQFVPLDSTWIYNGIEAASSVYKL